MPITIDRYQLTMDGETVFNGKFYRNLFINIFDSIISLNDDSTLIETRRYYIPKSDYIAFSHFLEECSYLTALSTVENILNLPTNTRVRRIEVKLIPC